jgi:hypothetical protein
MGQRPWTVVAWATPPGGKGSEVMDGTRRQAAGESSTHNCSFSAHQPGLDRVAEEGETSDCHCDCALRVIVTGTGRGTEVCSGVAARVSAPPLAVCMHQVLLTHPP